MPGVIQVAYRGNPGSPSGNPGATPDRHWNHLRARSGPRPTLRYGRGARNVWSRQTVPARINTASARRKASGAMAGPDDVPGPARLARRLLRLAGEACEHEGPAERGPG